MAPSPTQKRFKRKAGDALKKKRRVVIQKPKANSWFRFTKRPWFRSLKEFLMADSFAYGPLIDQEINNNHYTFADIGKVLKKTFVPSPTRVLKEALIGARKELKHVTELGGTDEEEDYSELGGGGQVVHIHNDSDAEVGNMVQKLSETGTVGQQVHMTIQKKVITTTTYPENELGELKSVLNMAAPQSVISPAPSHSPLDTTRDTELTDESEGDGEHSHAGGRVSLDFDTAKTVAGRLVEKLGGRFSEDLGIHVDDGDEEVERWFLAANLFSRSLPFNVSRQTYKELMALGVSKLIDFIAVEDVKLTELFEKTGYSKYGQRVTTHFRKLAYQVQDEMSGQVTKLKYTAESVDLVRRLRALNGVKLSAVHIFMRELRGVWMACDADFDNRTKKAALHLKLLRSVKPGSDPEEVLMTFAQGAGIDARDLEVACFKLGAVHEKDYGNCKGGPECDVLGSHDRFLSSLP